MGQPGRPRGVESERRRREFIRLVAAGTPFDRAAVSARVQPVRALAILSEPEVRQIIGGAA